MCGPRAGPVVAHPCHPINQSPRLFTLIPILFSMSLVRSGAALQPGHAMPRCTPRIASGYRPSRILTGSPDSDLDLGGRARPLAFGQPGHAVPHRTVRSHSELHYNGTNPGPIVGHGMTRLESMAWPGRPQARTESIFARDPARRGGAVTERRDRGTRWGDVRGGRGGQACSDLDVHLGRARPCSVRGRRRRPPGHGPSPARACHAPLRAAHRFAAETPQTGAIRAGT